MSQQWVYYTEATKPSTYSEMSLWSRCYVDGDASIIVLQLVQSYVTYRADRLWTGRMGKWMGQSWWLEERNGGVVFVVRGPARLNSSGLRSQSPFAWLPHPSATLPSLPHTMCPVNGRPSNPTPIILSTLSPTSVPPAQWMNGLWRWPGILLSLHPTLSCLSLRPPPQSMGEIA